MLTSSLNVSEDISMNGVGGAKLTLSEIVYKELKKDIFSAKFLPNMFISEKEIADTYQVSKGTASEALYRLCLDGHLVSFPRKGYRVNMLSVEEHRQIQRFRIALETLVLEILMEEVELHKIKELYSILEDELSPEDEYVSRNTKFHMELVKLTKDQFLMESLQHLLGSLTRTAVFFQKPDSYQSQDFHKGMLDSLIIGDLEKAKQYLKKDLIRN